MAEQNEHQKPSERPDEGKTVPKRGGPGSRHDGNRPEVNLPRPDMAQKRELAQQEMQRFVDGLPEEVRREAEDATTPEKFAQLCAKLGLSQAEIGQVMRERFHGHDVGKLMAALDTVQDLDNIDKFDLSSMARGDADKADSDIEPAPIELTEAEQANITAFEEKAKELLPKVGSTNKADQKSIWDFIVAVQNKLQVGKEKGLDALVYLLKKGTIVGGIILILILLATMMHAPKKG